MREIILGSTTVIYDIVKSSKRKKIEFIINEKGLTVNLPNNLEYGTDEIEKLIHENAEWILTKIIRLESKVPSKMLKIKHGGYLPYQGNNLRLRIYNTKSDNININLLDENIELKLPQNEISENKIITELIKWYKKQALDYLTSRTNKLSQELNVTPNKIMIREFKSRWGSCYKDNSIAFNWRLIMAPSWVQDYIIIHELLHIPFKSHNKEFQNTLKKLHPRANEAKNWLIINRENLYFTLSFDNRGIPL